MKFKIKQKSYQEWFILHLYKLYDDDLTKKGHTDRMGEDK